MDLSLLSYADRLSAWKMLLCCTSRDLRPRGCGFVFSCDFLLGMSATWCSACGFTLLTTMTRVWHVFCCITRKVRTSADMKTLWFFSPESMSAELLLVIKQLTELRYQECAHQFFIQWFFFHETLCTQDNSDLENTFFLARVLGWLKCPTRSIRLIIVSIFTDNPAMEKQDTFVEKLVTQVIKNLQVKISNIHVRYEDDVSIYPPPPTII